MDIQTDQLACFFFLSTVIGQGLGQVTQFWSVRFNSGTFGENIEIQGCLLELITGAKRGLRLPR
jgi:hypothetical protein